MEAGDDDDAIFGNQEVEQVGEAMDDGAVGASVDPRVDIGVPRQLGEDPVDLEPELSAQARPLLDVPLLRLAKSRSTAARTSRR